MGAQQVSDRVAIREVGMRDGLQSIAEIMPTATKLAWLDAEYAAGVREIEVSSFVPPKLLPQLADAEEIVRYALTLPGLTVSALIPNLRGAERGLALGVHEMNFVLSVSEGHNRSNVRRGTDESIADFRRVVQLCRERGGANRPRINCGLATSFGCTIEGDVDEDRVRRIAGEVAEAGTCGIMYLAEKQDDLARLAGWLDHARDYQLDTRVIDGSEVARLLPGSAKPWAGALYTPSDGKAEPQMAAPAIAAAARRQGATILTGCAVRGVGRAVRLPQADGWRLHDRHARGAHDRSRPGQLPASAGLPAEHPSALEK